MSPVGIKPPQLRTTALGGEQWDGSDYWLISLYGLIADGRAIPVGHHELQGSPGGLQTNTTM